MILIKLKILLKNITSINIFAKNIGSKLFKLGILLLASAPAVSFLLLLFSALLGISNRKDKFLNDKYNWLLILSSFLMIFNCFLITVDFIKIRELDKSLIWIGLLNWLPLFFCYWGFQKYLKTKKDRSDSAKIFIVGSIPVLISGFCQYFLGLYGPYRFFNNLIIWYQRPIGDDGSVSGLLIIIIIGLGYVLFYLSV